MTGERGQAEVRCRAWVASLGRVTEWQALLAEQAITLAALLDVEPNPAQAAAASRELRQIIGLLSPVASLNVPVPDRPAGEQAAQPVDPVGNLVQLVTRKQQAGGA